MNETETLDDYACGVHQSLMEKDVLMGIGSTPFFTIVMITVFLVSFIGMPCILIGLAALVTCRMLCKKEKMFLEFLFENLSEKDLYRG